MPNSRGDAARWASRVGSRLPAILAIGLPLVLYSVALNPYFLPDQFDNVRYFYGGGALAGHGSYAVHGEPITQWPPGLPLMLVPLFWSGLASVLAAKIVILACVVLGLTCAYRLLKAEGRPLPLLTCFLCAMVPAAFLNGTRIMSEWPFTAVSLLFLLVLRRLDGPCRSLATAVLAGVLLGWASLIRWIGVLLGAALLAQAVRRGLREKDGRLRQLFPEVLTMVIGAAIFLLWQCRQWWVGISGAHTADPAAVVQAPVPVYLGDPFAGLYNIVMMITEFYVRMDRLAMTLGFYQDSYPILTPSAAHLLFIPALLTLVGLARHLGRSRWQPADYYVLATLILFVIIDPNCLAPRYLLPVAPFLVGYGFSGGELIAGWLRAPRLWRRAVLPGAVAMWVALLLAYIGHLLVRGNAAGSHAGLSVLASPTAESFYRGRSLELYQISETIRQDPEPGDVAIYGDPGAHHYVRAFSGRHCPYDPRASRAQYVLRLGDAGNGDGVQLPSGFAEIYRSPAAVLFRRTDSGMRTMVRQQVTGST